MEKEKLRLNRRDFLKGTGVAAVGLAAFPQGLQAAPLKTVRVGVVGTGVRGTSLISNLAKLDGVKILALYDSDEAQLNHAQGVVQQAGQSRPEGYSHGETDWKRLCDRSDLDLVIAATPWKGHAAICITAMKAGKHAATEAPAALTVEECWDLVETSEGTKRHCALLEGSCYSYDSLMILNMIQHGLLGEPLYGETRYAHDLRAAMFEAASAGGEPWMLEAARTQNGDLYPAQPLGPVAWWFNVNRGDSFSYLVSMSSEALGLKQYAAKKFGPQNPRAQAKYKLGDINSTLIQTEKGGAVTLDYTTNNARPSEGLIRVQCTKGIYNCMLDMIYVDGRSNADAVTGPPHGYPWRGQNHWEDPKQYKVEYAHKLWHGREASDPVGAGGYAEHLALYRLIKNLREGSPLDVDVYDAATWSVIAPLSEASVAGRSKSVDVPDFTRGKWKTREPLDADALV